MIYCALGVLGDKRRTFHIDGIKLYHNIIGGFEDWKELKSKKGLFPVEISEDETLFKFLKSPSNKDKTVQKVIDIFYNAQPNSMLLVDGGLL
jgi:hypothetical protein